MKTKFIKVSVAERLPEKGKNVIVLSADGKSGTCYFLRGLWHGQKNGEPKYWFEEVPDREAEMLEMLKLISEKAEVIYHEEDGEDNRFFEEIDFEEIDQLIQEATTLK